MLLVIADILAMQKILGYSDAAYGSRQLFQATILYIFVFALLASAPLNAVLSRYVSDVIFNETYSDIMAAFHLGLWISMAIDAIMVVPFAIHEYIVGGVDIVYVVTSVCCFIALSLVFYTMLYLSLCKDYGKISLFYFIYICKQIQYGNNVFHASCNDDRIYYNCITWICTFEAVFYTEQ